MLYQDICLFLNVTRISPSMGFESRNETSICLRIQCIRESCLFFPLGIAVVEES